jgi:Superinfection immunity protein
MDNVTLIRVVAGVLAIGVFLLPLYVLPSILGWRKKQRIPILLVNLLLGWTVLGWVGALIWALADTPTQLSQPGAVAAFCPNCGGHMPAGGRICSMCGHSATEAVKAQTTAS